MPSIIAICLSFLQQIQKEGIKPIDFTKCICSFIDNLWDIHSNEEVALVIFGGHCSFQKLLCFNTDRQKWEYALSDAFEYIQQSSIKPTSNLISLKCFFDQLFSLCQKKHCTQVIIVNSGLHKKNIFSEELGIKETNSFITYNQLRHRCFSHRVKIHLILSCLPNHMTLIQTNTRAGNGINMNCNNNSLVKLIDQDIDKEAQNENGSVHLYGDLKCFGSFYQIFCQQSLTKLSLGQSNATSIVQLNHISCSLITVFNTILSEHYTQYTGMLQCGHLGSQITLSPDPSCVLSGGCGRSLTLNSLDLPPSLSIIGFLAHEHLQFPPLLSNHVLCNKNSHHEKIKSYKTTSSINTPPPKRRKMVDGKHLGAFSLPSPSFIFLLHQALVRSKKIAIVQLTSLLSMCPTNEPCINAGWYGAVYSNGLHLRLSIFNPCRPAPWIQQLQFQTSKLKHQSQEKIKKNIWNKIDFDHNWVQKRLGRIRKFVKGLPRTQLQLDTEVRKLENLANIYHSPQLKLLVQKIISHQDSFASIP